MKRVLNYTRRLIDGMLPERNASCSPTDAQNTTGSFDSLFEVGKKLASGSHGIVHEGIRKSDGTQVLIKFVKKHLFDFHIGDSEPLCREAAIMQIMEDSDHVVKLYDWIRMKDHDILIMEHPGASTTLFDHIKANGGRLTEAEAKDIMQKLIAALRHCSEQDVYYKGLSLKKVLIDPNTRQIKLTGFYRALTLSETRKGDRKSSGERRIHALIETNKGLHRVLKGMVKGEWFHGKNTDLSKECLDLRRELHHRESWINLENILDHAWFKETPDPDAIDSKPTDDQTSQHVTSTSEAEVLPIAEEPGHAKVGDEWSDVSFQDLVRDCSDDVPQVTDCATSDCGVNNVHVGPTGDTVSPPLKKPEDNKIIDTGFYSYEIGRKLAEGANDSIYAGIRFEDGLEVALKFTDKVGIEWIDIEGHPEPVPKEIGLLILANKGPRVPQIIQLLDWVEEPERYIMVLELPKPCVDLFEFFEHLGGYIGESTVKVIMQQVTLAAQTCCQRGVLHRNVNLGTLLINPETLEVKLTDFGCGEILTNAGYTSYPGTKVFCPPEFHLNGMYHGEPATVWSLGILLFVLLCGQFPESEELDKLNDNIWIKEGLSQECCELLCSLLQRNPEKRLELDSVCRHNWFKKFKCQPENNEIIDTGFYSYEIDRKLGEGGYGSVYAGIRLKDGLEVALKFAHKVGIECIDIEGHPEPVPKEIGLLILANKGPRVPQIIQLLDWVEEPERYIMVLELPKPCEDLLEFYERLEGYIGESKATVIMQQVTLAAQTCCQRGVLHRDIKLKNLLINPDTLEVKLIDFGCGEILTNAGYTSYAGTEEYCPPEFDLNDKYHGEPATVWSLGILLFVLLCGDFPESEELDKLNDNIWTKEGLSQECCEFLCSLLQRNPEKRLELDSVCRQNWFKKFKCQPENNEIIDTGLYSYEIGRKLAEGGYGCVYAGIRLKDGLEVALKFAHKVGIECIDIEGHPEPVPKEIGLLILANKGPRVPQIIQLLDWVEEPERYIMVLELPKPCVDLFEFYECLGGYIGESTATLIMQQVTLAAQTCCQREVLHRDINLGSLLINPDTLEVKLTDFGCGEILTNAGYTSYPGTEPYCPPEFDLNGMYHGEPATVWSLGILLFVLLCGDFPESEELDELNDNIWTADGLSQECCEFLCSLLQRNPEKRLELDSVCRHNWFKKFKCQPEKNEIIDTGFYSYEIGRKLIEGGYGCVYAGIRFEDGLEVALKFAHKVGIEWIDIEGHPEPVPKEIGLLILANKGPRVPQIIQLLDWVEEPERYIMVLELPKPCENLLEFYKRLEGYIGESTASVVMQQVTLAAQTCCQRGVLHGDIKLRNLLINPDTLEVKLIDFGHGKILTNAGYTSYAGTEAYCPPEYKSNGMYHGEPATVWSLGILLFVLMCGQFPESEELDELNDNIWTKEGLSQECCELLCSLLQRNPEKRLELDNVCRHNWFKKFKCQPENNEIIEKAPVRRKRPGCFDRLRKAMKGVFSSSSSNAGNVVEPFISPADPVLEPSSPAPVHSGFKTNNEKAPVRRKRPGCFDRLWKATKGVFSSSSSSAVTVVEPFIPPADPVLEPSSPAPVHSGFKTNNGRITSSVHVERRWSGDASESPNQQGLSRSDSLEGFLCPPLPGQVPVEPIERSTF